MLSHRSFTTISKVLTTAKAHQKLPESLKTAIYEPPIGDKLTDGEKLKLKHEIEKNFMGYKDLQDKGAKLEKEQERVDDGVYP